MMKAHMRSRRFDSRMAWAWWRPQGEWRASMMGKPPPLCSTSPPRNQGRPASAAASRARSSCTMASSWTWVTERPLCGCRRMVGKCPTTMVWKCTIRYLPSAGWSNPESSSRRGVSMAPPATMTSSASLVRVAPSGPTNSTPVARRPCVTMRLT